MDTSYLIIIFSLSVLISYVFDLLSSRYKTPSVILLLASGMLLRQVTNYFAFQLPYVDTILPTLGTLGLILIVLEGALELELTGDKLGMIRRAFWASLSSILVTSLLMAALFYVLMEASFFKCLVAAMPFAIISSAVAIPGSKNLNLASREFVVYESSLSDILGVMIFNFLVYNASGGILSILSFAKDTLIMVILSLICCFFLLYLISKINHHIKFLPIISVLFLVYAVSRIYQLSPLLLILVFGLFLNNTELFIRGRLDRIFKNDLFEKELDQFKNLTAEGAFIVRTFFFLLFGYASDVYTLIEPDALIVSFLLLLILYSVRTGILRLSLPGSINPVVFIAPRGLITILLYLSIPENLKLVGFRDGILMAVVLLTALVMMAGVISYKETEPL
ncbi:sodium:proton exchanger [Larkinella terrae]|uniref:Sodium:proton exchanger n=1 Tax=Larkinella terrae TaxID=2025311 RepID=A0A7K0EE72_9BACT|nr:sodium:proton exchanger [Larkinella terrae]MRS60002.1 sodium:proton exchanger [Larkinella terrae]